MRGSDPPEDAAMEVPLRPAGRADDLHPARIEVGSKRPHRRGKHQPTINGDPPQHRPVRHRTGGVTAAPQPAAHDAVSGSRGSGLPGSWTMSVPDGGSGPRQRGHKRQRDGRMLSWRSAAKRAPQRRQYTRRLISGSPRTATMSGGDRSGRRRRRQSGAPRRRSSSPPIERTVRLPHWPGLVRTKWTK